METRTVKNVCAPAAVIEDKIYIIGGKLGIKTYCNCKKNTYINYKQVYFLLFVN